MTDSPKLTAPWGTPSGGMTRRSSFKWAATAAAGVMATASSTSVATAGPGKADDRRRSTKRYKMKKSINQWAFPYPERMNLRECMQLAKDAGFDGIELNYDLDNDLSPKSGTKEYHAIRKMADEIGIAISGLCSFLFWPYPLTSNDPQERKRGMELAGLMTRAAHDLGVENLLVVPGAVHMPWREDHDPTPNDVCDKRAREAMGKLLPTAEKLKVKLNVENIFFNVSSFIQRSPIFTKQSHLLNLEQIRFLLFLYLLILFNNLIYLIVGYFDFEFFCFF